MDIKSMIVSAITKKGILYEANKIDMEFTIPASILGDKDVNKIISITINADNVKMTLQKD